MNKKQITIIASIILAMPLMFAMIAGENKTVSFSGEVSGCYIYDNIGNLSNYDLDGLNFTESRNDVIIYSNPLLKPGNITISCLVKGQREITNGGSTGNPGGRKPKKKEINNTIINVINDTIDKPIDNGVDSQDADDIEPEKSNKWKYVIALVFIIALLGIGYNHVSKKKD